MKYPMFKVHIDTEKALEQIEPVLNSGFVNEGTSYRTNKLF